MRDIPKWISNFVRGNISTCTSCGKVLRESDIAFLGIEVRGSGKAANQRGTVCGFKCHHCHTICMVEISYSASKEYMAKSGEECYSESIYEALSEEDRGIDDEVVAEALREAKADHRAKQENRITIEEMKEVHDFLEKIKYHEELLVAMGMSPKEIKKYGKTKGDKK